MLNWTGRISATTNTTASQFRPLIGRSRGAEAVASISVAATSPPSACPAGNRVYRGGLVVTLLIAMSGAAAARLLSLRRPGHHSASCGGNQAKGKNSFDVS